MNDQQTEHRLRAALEAGLRMRDAQRHYFKVRHRQALIESKEAERQFDQLATAALALPEERVDAAYAAP